MPVRPRGLGFLSYLVRFAGLHYVPLDCIPFPPA